MIDIVLIAHNLRSCHNVGSLLRTAEGLGVRKVLLTGYTPYPLVLEDARVANPTVAHAQGLQKDTRMPHIAARLHRQIQKTALGAESSVAWVHQPSAAQAIASLRAEGYVVAAIEQDPASMPLPGFRPPAKIALLVGREVEGIEPEILVLADNVLEIPMFGQKESFNVVQAAAMALYHCRFHGS